MKSSCILIVEDEAAKAEPFETYLTQKGYFPLVYMDGASASEDIENGLLYDLALFDLALPYHDGIDLLRLSKELHPDIAVLTMSAYDFSHELSQRHFKKPFRLEELLRGIQNIIT